jgi:hypothetical protein
LEKLHLDWVTCAGNGWCGLRNVNLDNDAADVDGVYVIVYFETKENYKAVKVGQSRAEDGGVSSRLKSHKEGKTEESKKILENEKHGTLYVTWAEVPVLKLNGVERYLGEMLKVDSDAVFPTSDLPILVNLP